MCVQLFVINYLQILACLAQRKSCGVAQITLLLIIPTSVSFLIPFSEAHYFGVFVRCGRRFLQKEISNSCNNLQSETEPLF